jgi:hypothetical protein
MEGISEQKPISLPRLGEKAPDFDAVTTHGKLSWMITRGAG